MYYGASVFYGFTIKQEYIDELMKDMDRYFSYDVTSRIEKIVSDDTLELTCYGDQDIKTYAFKSKDHSIDYSEILQLPDSLESGPAREQLRHVRKILGKDNCSNIGWYLAASYD